MRHLDIENVYFNADEYCYEKGKYSWNLKICSNSKKTFWKNFSQIFSTSLSILLFVFIIFVYEFYKDLRNTYGECVIFLLASQVIKQGAMALILVGSYSKYFYMSALTGEAYSLYWFCALCFHNTWKIKYEVFNF